jgi:hypothetical protein
LTSTRNSSAVGDDPYDPGSQVTWFGLEDPEKNHWTIVEV